MLNFLARRIVRAALQHVRGLGLGQLAHHHQFRQRRGELVLRMTRGRQRLGRVARGLMDVGDEVVEEALALCG